MSVFDRIVVFIPAFKKSVQFQDDLIRKLSGVPLVQTAIDKALFFGVPEGSIHLITDSEEIDLLSRRANIGVFLDSSLNWESAYENNELRQYVSIAEKGSKGTLLLSAYAPLLSKKSVADAVDTFFASNQRVLKPTRVEKHCLIDGNDHTLAGGIFSQKKEVHRIESGAFALLKKGVFLADPEDRVSVIYWDVTDDAREIESLQDWWVCEKLLHRKRIVFRIIGNKNFGMGHIYRALTLAQEFQDHEVIFITDTDNRIAVESMLKQNYWLAVYEADDVINQIEVLQPDLVICDALDTNRIDVEKLQMSGAVVVSFEDLGDGARNTNLTINELYDKPQFDGDHILWGYRYFFLRDEFETARRHRFKTGVDCIMLAFGGTDQHDLTRTIFRVISSFCKEQGIFIHIVTGPGYPGYERLEAEVAGQEGVSLTHASGVISGIMEQAQLAITTNGRTVYELAHMNIPSIVIAQHQRELTHAFAKEENGFIPLFLYQREKTNTLVLAALEKLVRDNVFREHLFRRMTPFNFSRNKKRVVKKILRLFEDPDH